MPSAATSTSTLSQSKELQKEISNYYRIEKKKIRDNFAARKVKLNDATINALTKYNIDAEVAKEIVSLSKNFEENDRTILKSITNNPHSKRIKRKLKSYELEINDIDARELKNLKDLADQRKRLAEVLSLATLGQGYYNILSFLPVEEQYERVMAVLKEVRFDKNKLKRFQPGKVQFVFALSAVHKELILNLVNKGSQNNYNRLLGILESQKWNFVPSIWDQDGRTF